MSTARKILFDAAALLERNHWARRNYHAVEERGGKIVDCFCAQGAIYFVSGRLAGERGTDATNASVAAIRAMDRLALTEFSSLLIPWNDNVARNKRQVVRFLRRGARSLVDLEKRP